MYGPELAEFYDKVYEMRGKDYRGESSYVTEMIRSCFPDARSLLDVGCGTGAHLAFFREMFDHTEGIELSEDMLSIARRRLPGAPLHQGDMRAFDLERRFDAIVCLFGSVGHMATQHELEQALTCFARHLPPGGVVAIEPWWFLETYLDGYVSGDVVTPDHRTIARVSHTKREGAGSRMQVHYVIADRDSGARHFTEEYTHRLFTREEYVKALEVAGFTPDYIDGVLGGRGLFLGTRKGEN
ncbi:class I SAM-dependent DNA methyltransferase [Halostreptopolyspora alba]|uniref:Class I SAM-dependent methyltransferase n=1 Tax=Halostreptopolyspora alba TaxID=2487137 RepID=A0A3N0EFY0_9ACTN|nr:class I SAM-dependent methyltransferase [Nocardiopsaceae bacterium YIM 96095]